MLAVRRIDRDRPVVPDPVSAVEPTGDHVGAFLGIERSVALDRDDGELQVPVGFPYRPVERPASRIALDAPHEIDTIAEICELGEELDGDRLALKQRGVLPVERATCELDGLAAFNLIRAVLSVHHVPSTARRHNQRLFAARQRTRHALVWRDSARLPRRVGMFGIVERHRHQLVIRARGKELARRERAPRDAHGVDLASERLRTTSTSGETAILSADNETTACTDGTDVESIGLRQRTFLVVDILRENAGLVDHRRMVPVTVCDGRRRDVFDASRAVVFISARQDSIVVDAPFQEWAVDERVSLRRAGCFRLEDTLNGEVPGRQLADGVGNVDYVRTGRGPSGRLARGDVERTGVGEKRLVNTVGVAPCVVRRERWSESLAIVVGDAKLGVDIGEREPARHVGIVVGGIMDVPVPCPPNVVCMCLDGERGIRETANLVLAVEADSLCRAVESEQEGRVVVRRTFHKRHEQDVVVLHLVRDAHLGDVAPESTRGYAVRLAANGERAVPGEVPAVPIIHSRAAAFHAVHEELGGNLPGVQVVHAQREMMPLAVEERRHVLHVAGRL